MRILRRALLLLLLTLSTPLLAAVQAGPAKSIALTVVSLPNDRHVYYVRLLEEALRQAGYTPDIQIIQGAPQPRIWQMLASNQISLMWGVQTTARNKEFASVENDLTNGLIGQRVFLVREGEQDMFAHVHSLAQLRQTGMIGGVGEGWFDAELWPLNKLPVYIKGGDWRLMFRMVANGERDVNYVVRGVNEIINEVREYPGLAIESNLVLQHDRDMRFYLSPEAAALKPVLQEALAKADRSGLKKKLIKQLIMPELDVLHLNKRTRLKLVSPPV